MYHHHVSSCIVILYHRVSSWCVIFMCHHHACIICASCMHHMCIMHASNVHHAYIVCASCTHRVSIMHASCVHPSGKLTFQYPGKGCKYLSKKYMLASRESAHWTGSKSDHSSGQNFGRNIDPKSDHKACRNKCVLFDPNHVEIKVIYLVIQLLLMEIML